jgi:uncharacterized repeat protein (TIGR03803 family)
MSATKVSRTLLAVAGALLLSCSALAQGHHYAELHRFDLEADASDGAFPTGSLTLVGSTLYGMTQYGGDRSYGTVFRIDADGTGFAALHSYTGNDGDSPSEGSLIFSGTALYGSASWLIRLNTDGTAYTVLHRFRGDTGSGWGTSGPPTLSGATFYATSPYGGDYNRGTVFKINADGTGYTLLHSFAGGTTEGRVPYDSLALSGSTLYGTTTQGGAYDLGTMYGINTDGTGLILLHSFAGGATDGATPYAGLALSGSTLYGTTSIGGSANLGTIFKINTDGSGFMILHSFAGGTTDGKNPGSSLTISGSTLYGTTSDGGTGHGTVFRINTDGSGFAVLHSFTSILTDAEGWGPSGHLIMSGSTLFGMTNGIGAGAGGIVFALSPNGPLIVAQPSDELAMAGGSAGFTVRASEPDSNPLVYRWQRRVAGSTAWTDLSDGGGYSGTAAATLIINPITAAMNGDSFRCAVDNGYGEDTSSPASLTVFTTVNVTSQTRVAATSSSSWDIKSVTFEVQFTGALAGLDIHWESSVDGGVTWDGCGSGVTSFPDGIVRSDLTINPSFPGAYMSEPQEMRPTMYRCVISNAYGTATSVPVTYSIGTAVDITTQPLNRAATAGNSANFGVTAFGWSGLTYQWQRQAAGNTTWINLTDGASYSGTATATLTVSPVTEAMNGDSFRCVVDSSYGEETSSPAKLTVTNAVVITAQPSIQSATAGYSAMFTLTATGVSPLTYQWQRQVAGSTTWADLTDGGSYRGAGTATLTVNPTTEAMNGDAFQCLVSNGFGSATSASAHLAVTNAVTFTAQPSSQTAGTGGNATFSVSVTGAPPLLYHWQREPAGSPTWSNLADGAVYRGSATATLTVNAVTTAMSGDLFQCVVSNDLGSTTSSAAALVVPTPMTVSTLAGQGGHSGGGDGTSGSAQFFGPADVAVDTAGNIFVADTDNHTIRKITPVGAVSTLAGYPGSAGSVDGTGAAARFNHPSGLAVDGMGNVFVADTDNYTIRKVTPAGIVTTLAGQASVRGRADGATTAAQFNGPSGLAMDAAGNLYVADTLNHTLRKITPSGVVSTFAGTAGAAGSADGTGTAARFFGLQGLAADGGGNLFVADTNNQIIRKVDLSTGAVTTVAGLAGASGSVDAPGSLARFFYPSAVAVDGAGNLYVADTDNNIIRQITPAGVVSTIAGQPGAGGSVDGVGTVARFNHPSGIAADSSGNLYIADTDNQTVRLGYSSAALAITTQPQSQTVTAASNVQFSVTASGRPAPAYQWYLNGAAISGATNSTLSLANAQATNAGDYTVVVSNTSGSVTSNRATLTVSAITASAAASVGGGGGGGAIESWFVLGLLGLAAGRRIAVDRRR